MKIGVYLEKWLVLTDFAFYYGISSCIQDEQYGRNDENRGKIEGGSKKKDV